MQLSSLEQMMLNRQEITNGTVFKVIKLLSETNPLLGQYLQSIAQEHDQANQQLSAGVSGLTLGGFGIKAEHLVRSGSDRKDFTDKLPKKAADTDAATAEWLAALMALYIDGQQTPDSVVLVDGFKLNSKTWPKLETIAQSIDKADAGVYAGSTIPLPQEMQADAFTLVLPLNDDNKSIMLYDFTSRSAFLMTYVALEDEWVRHNDFAFVNRQSIELAVRNWLRSEGIQAKPALDLEHALGYLREALTDAGATATKLYATFKDGVVEADLPADDSQLGTIFYTATGKSDKQTWDRFTPLSQSAAMTALKAAIKANAEAATAAPVVLDAPAAPAADAAPVDAAPATDDGTAEAPQAPASEAVAS